MPRDVASLDSSGQSDRYANLGYGTLTKFGYCNDTDTSTDVDTQRGPGHSDPSLLPGPGQSDGVGPAALHDDGVRADPTANSGDRKSSMFSVQ